MPFPPSFAFCWIFCAGADSFELRRYTGELQHIHNICGWRRGRFRDDMGSLGRSEALIANFLTTAPTHFFQHSNSPRRRWVKDGQSYTLCRGDACLRIPRCFAHLMERVQGSVNIDARLLRGGTPARVVKIRVGSIRVESITVSGLVPGRRSAGIGMRAPLCLLRRGRLRYRILFPRRGHSCRRDEHIST